MTLSLDLSVLDSNEAASSTPVLHSPSLIIRLEIFRTMKKRGQRFKMGIIDVFNFKKGVSYSKIV